jgi:hypothetical protein
MCLATCALLGACATQGELPREPARKQAAAPAAPMPTLLRFDWGNELDADVFAIREEFTFKGDSERVSRLEAQFHLRAERRGDRYVLTFSELQMKLDGRPVTQNADPAMLGPITGLVLDYEIAPNGDFIGLRDFARYQAFSERSYLEQNDKLPPNERLSRQEAREHMKSTSSREVLQVAPARTWGALVGMWAGVTMTQGKPLTSDSTVTVPIINAPLTVHSRFELIRREACASGERDKNCVRLRATSRPDPTQLADASRKLKESRGGAAETLAANGMQVEDRYELLTEPGTLRPRWAEWVRGADIEGSEQGSELLQSRQSTRTRMIFVYR